MTSPTITRGPLFMYFVARVLHVPDISPPLAAVQQNCSSIWSLPGNEWLDWVNLSGYVCEKKKFFFLLKKVEYIIFKIKIVCMQQTSSSNRFNYEKNKETQSLMNISFGHSFITKTPSWGCREPLSTPKAIKNKNPAYQNTFIASGIIQHVTNYGPRQCERGKRKKHTRVSWWHISKKQYICCTQVGWTRKLKSHPSEKWKPLKSTYLQVWHSGACR